MERLAATIIVLVAVATHCHCLTVSSCNTNPADDIIQIISLDVQPAKIVVPGSLLISASVNVTQPINGNLQADVTIKKKIGIAEINLPCINNMGSCTYRDACSLLKNATANGCPKILRDNKIPCSCPVAAGIYSLSNVSTHISDKILGFKIPLLAGEYQVNLRLTDSVSMKQVACFDATVELVDPPSSNIFSSFGRFLTGIFGG